MKKTIVKIGVKSHDTIFYFILCGFFYLQEKIEFHHYLMMFIWERVVWL